LKDGTFYFITLHDFKRKYIIEPKRGNESLSIISFDSTSFAGHFVLCSVEEISIYVVASGFSSKIYKYKVTDKILKASIIELEDDILALLFVDSKASFKILALPDLSPIIADQSLMLESKDLHLLKKISLCQHRLLFFTENDAILGCTIKKGETSVKGELFISGIPTPDRPNSLLKSIFKREPSKMNFEKLSASSSTVVVSPEKKSNDSHSQLKSKSVDVTSTKNVMANNLVALQKNTEKMSQLQEKTQEMSDNAQDFYKMAKELSEREKKKSRFFGF